MNIRFSENSIRFRISRTELEQLLQNGEISQSTPLPEGQSFIYRILTSPENAIGLSLEWRAQEIFLFAPSFQLQDMLARPPAKHLGCYQDLPTLDGRVLRIELEVGLFSERRASSADSTQRATKPNRP